MTPDVTVPPPHSTIHIPQVEVSSLHSELVEADRVLISHNLKNSPLARVDNRDLYDAMKDAAVANRSDIYLLDEARIERNIERHSFFSPRKLSKFDWENMIFGSSKPLSQQFRYHEMFDKNPNLNQLYGIIFF